MNNKKYVNATYWNIFDKIINFFKNIIASIILARCLGVNDYGSYCYIISLITILQCFPKFGLENIVIKDFSNKENKFSYFLSVFLVSMIGSLTGSFFVAIMGILNHFSIKLVLFIIIFFFFHWCEIFRYLLYACYETKKYTLCKDFIVLIELCFYVWAARIHVDVEDFICIYLFCELAILWSGGVLSRRYVETWEKEVNICNILKETRHLLEVCMPLTFSALSVSIYMKIDQVMIKHLLDETQLGLYSIVVKIAESWYFLPTTLCISLLPKFAQLYNENQKKMWDKYEEYMAMLVAISILIGGLISVFANPIINMLYGSDYESAIPALCMYAWGGIFASLGCARGIYIAIREYTMTAFMISVLGALLNVLLNFVLIPRLGLYGACLATLISYAVQSWLMNFAFMNTRKVAICQTKALLSFYKAPVKFFSYFKLMLMRN